MNYQANFQGLGPQILKSKRANIEYQILELIGQGSEGSVYRGKQIQSKFVAIKSQSTPKQFDVLQKFATMEFQNLINVREIISNQGGVYIIMDHADGELYKYMQSFEYQQKSIGQKLELFIQIVKGVDELHKQNIIHRDLKPENILYFKKENGELQLKLSDFGLMKQIKNNFQTANIGTPYYWAPELISDEDSAAYTEKVDIWALGMILIEMLTGKPLLYKIQTIEGIKNYLKGIQQQKINAEIEQCQVFKEELKQILIKKLLVIDQSKRIKAEQLIVELQELVVAFQPKSNQVQNNFQFRLNNQNPNQHAQSQGTFQIAPKFPQQQFLNNNNQPALKLPFFQNQNDQVMQNKFKLPNQPQFPPQSKGQQQQFKYFQPQISDFQNIQISQNTISVINANNQQEDQNHILIQKSTQTEKQELISSSIEEIQSTTTQISDQSRLTEKDDLIKQRDLELMNLQEKSRMNEKITNHLKTIFQILELKQPDQPYCKYIKSLILKCEALKLQETNSEFKQDFEHVNQFLKQQKLELKKIKVEQKNEKSQYEKQVQQNQQAQIRLEQENERKLGEEQQKFKQWQINQTQKLNEEKKTIYWQNLKQAETIRSLESSQQIEKLHIINLLNDIIGQTLLQFMKTLQLYQKKVSKIQDDDATESKQYKNSVLQVFEQISTFSKELQSFKLKIQSLRNEKDLTLINEQQTFTEHLVLNVLKTVQEGWDQIQIQKQQMKVGYLKEEKQLLTDQNCLEQYDTEVSQEIQNQFYQLICEIARCYQRLNSEQIDKMINLALNILFEFEREKNQILKELRKKQQNLSQLSNELSRLKQKFQNKFNIVKEQSQFLSKELFQNHLDIQAKVRSSSSERLDKFKENYKDLASTIQIFLQINKNQKKLKMDQSRQQNNYAQKQQSKDLQLSNFNEQEYTQIIQQLQNLIQKYDELKNIEEMDSLLNRFEIKSANQII